LAIIKPAEQQVNSHENKMTTQIRHEEDGMQIDEIASAQLKLKAFKSRKETELDPLNKFQSLASAPKNGSKRSP
jgi:hypothetical protein